MAATRKNLVHKFFKLSKIWEDIDKRLEDLVKQKKITGGCLYVYASYYNYGVEQMLKRSYDEWMSTMKHWDMNYYVNKMEEDLEIAAKFVEEQEAASIENCQRTQVMNKKGNEEVATC